MHVCGGFCDRENSFLYDVRTEFEENFDGNTSPKLSQKYGLHTTVNALINKKELLQHVMWKV